MLQSGSKLPSVGAPRWGKEIILKIKTTKIIITVAA
jgi:hypothetical protein